MSCDVRSLPIPLSPQQQSCCPVFPLYSLIKRFALVVLCSIKAVINTPKGSLCLRLWVTYTNSDPVRAECSYYNREGGGVGEIKRAPANATD
jgi:hypothetical protein